ncbi:MAG: hypothetical protein AAF602_31530, partial [Myxococcota bacterium]
MRTSVLVLDERYVAPCREAGLDVLHVARPARAQLAEARIVALGPDWDRLRDWRLGGARFAAMVFTPLGAPSPRAP